MKYGIIVLGVIVILTGAFVSYNYFQNDNSNQNVNLNNVNAGNVNTSNVNISNTNTSETEVITKSNCVADDCLQVSNLEYPAGELPNSVVTALNSAIDDEYKARATYEAVISKFGSVRPFSMIIRAEEQHISSLKALYDKYGETIPEDPYQPATIEIPVTIKETCQVGVEAEIANARLYRDELLPAVTEYEDITTVFTSLMDASQDKHLTSFEKCN
ncbi:MAG: hypothetical protein WC693_03420 [Patescibacteria group bacterium]